MPAPDLPPVVWGNVIKSAKPSEGSADKDAAKAPAPRPIPGPARARKATTYNINRTW